MIAKQKRMQRAAMPRKIAHPGGPPSSEELEPSKSLRDTGMLKHGKFL
jgi:hypothetical protein